MNKKIVFDIETAAEDFEKMDKVTKEFLTKKTTKQCREEEAQRALEKMKEDLVFSPLTSQIVAVGVLDAETKKGAVYFSHPSEEISHSGKNSIKAFEEQGIKYKPMGEAEILDNFWKVAEHAGEFVSFNGRGFDVPFLMIRSAIHKIRPSKNLLSNRYLSSQQFGAKHIDLMDQLNFYGATWGKMNLHLACRAFGIKSPKEEGINGDDVTRLYREGKYLDIARYNARDLFSTLELFEYWSKYLRF